MIDRQITSDNVVDIAFEWICKRWQDYSHDSDIWDLRIRWLTIWPHLQALLLAGGYIFSPTIEIRLPDGKGGIEKRELWCSQDALVLKQLLSCSVKLFIKTLSYNLFGETTG